MPLERDGGCLRASSWAPLSSDLHLHFPVSASGVALTSREKLPYVVMRPSMDEAFETFERVLDIVVCLGALYFLSYTSVFLFYLCLLLPLAYIFEAPEAPAQGATPPEDDDAIKD
ncbi:hypothetical protein JRQ81_017050 [Phrynocephalus forsythii]|uniref:Uncharacterized protein n=1 Tax=Phrynocephalus forsythii TaxID=171643 RepID=A0A9Q1B1Q1_9SAUR|nr:hypothetical protein JRQ81_017050 [Phrynocephalus forsythii]